ncbi:uncharacterized protein LACBIDRAFT_332637 [Laccaria bicolor S238N-H82]|uniref:Predicted protein n=1 Tax=Laccaria bicolor (strain S238N-H82 / ATCC MYA-4686) TaxID=486041 RepID=B0DTE5_LACBS|nr:uncharacterized protein LACBIDRAFT_332637 [Laccaria bicolor S238N-H82]EDR02100.1 predicted protein [Laccaria bicolor S238N-H82]|eukprot:XP_001887257.1 predicted protein [Laccaria bicolor S238N-H82]
MAAFKRLDDAERQRWEEIVQQEHLEHKKRLENLEGEEGLMDPEAAQEVLDRLPNLLGPLIQIIGEAIGMNLLVLIGGPEPKKKGQLNIIGIHHGCNLAPSPKLWPFAEKEKWDVAKRAFLGFVSTCYTTEQQRARALIPSAEPPTAGPSTSFASDSPPPSTPPSPTPLPMPSAPTSHSADLKTRHKRKAGKSTKNPAKKAKRAQISKKGKSSAVTSDGSNPSDSGAEEPPTDDGKSDNSDDAVNSYVQLESHTSFQAGSRSEGFKPTNRPSEVAWWVARGRKVQPKVVDTRAFEQQWWKWWKGLQPIWREVVGVDGALNASHRLASGGDGGWTVVNKHGRNAFLTVMATLVWWAEGLKDCARDPGWVAAVEEVVWVLDQMVKSLPFTHRVLETIATHIDQPGEGPATSVSVRQIERLYV